MVRTSRLLCMAGLSEVGVGGGGEEEEVDVCSCVPVTEFPRVLKFHHTLWQASKQSSRQASRQVGMQA